MIYEEEVPTHNPFNNISDRKKDGVPSFDPFKIYGDSEIDINSKITRPPIAISIGEYEHRGIMYPVAFGSYGDISCIVGASKSKKTFLKSAITAAYIGGDSINYFPNMGGVKSVGKTIIDIDTEQSKYHSQRTFRRVQEMTGITNENYKCFSLREYLPNERLKFVKWLLTESPLVGNIGLVLIDGFADLITDFNNIDQASDLTNNLMKWSTDNQCHILGILHRNFGTQKPVGHLGSFILKKSETVVFVENDIDTGLTHVKCEYSRNIPFKDFYFELDGDHLPIKVDAPVNLKLKDKSPF